MKVILNKCFGGFSVSDQVYQLYAQKKGFQIYRYYLDFNEYKKHRRFLYRKLEKYNKRFLIDYYFIDLGECFEYNPNYHNNHIHLNYTQREDPILIECIEELGEKANGDCAKLEIVEIPDNLKYTIDCYDGYETLHEDVQTY